MGEQNKKEKQKKDEPVFIFTQLQHSPASKPQLPSFDSPGHI